MGCSNKCERERTKSLIDGSVVCGYCEEWRHECEARYLFAMPLQKRREALNERLRHRGVKGVERLKQTILELWNAKQAATPTARKPASPAPGKTNIGRSSRKP